MVDIVPQKYVKQFERWGAVKEEIHNQDSAVPLRYHTRELWWVSLGVNIGYEQDGNGDKSQRPVVILKGFSANTCLVIPLTTSAKEHMYRVPVGIIDGENAVAHISQIRVIDVRRLIKKIGMLDSVIFELVRKKAKDML
jgi:mRNA interferase MazF